jgi:hypothetical protein
MQCAECGAGIIHLNAQHDTENTGQKGYHETLTIFWLTILSFYSRKFSSIPNAEMIKIFLTSSLSDRALPFLFYEKEKVLSAQYRAQFILPDKLTLEDVVIERLLN